MNRFASALPMPFARAPRAQAGATMIEVLVAILIFSIGLLGVASTQTVGLSNTQSALHRSYAAQLSYELVDIIRANPIEARNTASIFASYDTEVSASVPTTVANCLQVSGSCSTDEMAKTALAQWTARLQSALPEGEAELSLSRSGGRLEQYVCRTCFLLETWAGKLCQGLPQDWEMAGTN